MKLNVILATTYLVLCFSSCTILSKADQKQEIKHPGYYLKGKGKVLSQSPDSVKMVFTLKNKARKTSYENIDLLVQLKKANGSASCSFSRKFQTAPLKPKRKQKIYYSLHCPYAEADRIEFLNITGDPVGK